VASAGPQSATIVPRNPSAFNPSRRNGKDSRPVAWSEPSTPDNAALLELEGTDKKDIMLQWNRAPGDGLGADSVDGAADAAIVHRD